MDPKKKTEASGESVDGHFKRDIKIAHQLESKHDGENMTKYMTRRLNTISLFGVCVCVFPFTCTPSVGGCGFLQVAKGFFMWGRFGCDG